MDLDNSILMYALFIIVCLVAYTLQGITGFAGTVIAMAPSIMIVGYDIAKPALNFVGLISAIYVICKDMDKIDYKEFKKITSILLVGVAFAFAIKKLNIISETMLYIIFIVFVIVVSVKGLIEIYTKKTFNIKNDFFDIITLLFGGIIHGIFVSGGPVIVGYLSNKIHDKAVFRSTICLMWVVLNGVIFLTDLFAGNITKDVMVFTGIATPILFIGFVLGLKLFDKMSQEGFMKISYIVMFAMSIIFMFNL